MAPAGISLVMRLAVDGPLSGRQLQPVVHADHFWFAWAAFVPQTRIWAPDGPVLSDAAD
jgi:hypothetical protein